MAIVNGESKYAEEFLAFPFDKKIKYTVADALLTSVLGEHTPINVAAALTVARTLGVDESVLRQTASRLQGVPGRIEMIPEAQAHGFRVIVDYAFEPVAMEALYRTVESVRPTRIIHVLGATGGGRDRARRPLLGRIAAMHADVVILTNEDPYDEDPTKIIEEVARGVEEAIKELSFDRRNSPLILKILDRKEAIGKALSMARKGDMVLITGKGSEQAICIAGGKKIPWDDRNVVRELLQNYEASYPR